MPVSIIDDSTWRGNTIFGIQNDTISGKLTGIPLLGSQELWCYVERVR